MNALTQRQLKTLGDLIQVGSADASRALSTWLGRDVKVGVEQLDQVSLEAAVELAACDFQEA
jgi:chemotaxis protein CheY-P-specific phosphatase CheC